MQCRAAGVALEMGDSMDDLPLITTIAVAFTAAWFLGLFTQYLRLSPIVGYLLAGVLIGPHTPGIRGDVHMAHELSELGVILLMFGVGLHFHLKDLLAVKAVAIPGALIQSACATIAGVVIFSAFGMPTTTAAIVGMAMAVASTVVLMRVLTDADSLQSPSGHVAVGWLLVEDVLTVVVLVLIPMLGGEVANAEGGTAEGTAGLGIWGAIGLALLKLGVLVAIVMLAGSRLIPWVLVQVARLRSRELFTLTVLVLSIAVAAGAYAFFGASMALGAFLAGMVVAQSPVSHQAAADVLPMRDAFAVLFFVSVGMLLDPYFVAERPGLILAALGIVLVVKPLTALIVVAVLGYSARTALTVALGLAQIGEFSFILSELARKNHLMPDEGQNVLVAVAILSITINPLIFRYLPQIENWARQRKWLWTLLNGRAEHFARLKNEATEGKIVEVKGDRRLAIVVGFGPVGRAVHRLLCEAGLTTVVIDMNMDTVSELKSQGELAIFGDASHESILEQAGIHHASHLILTLPHSGARLAVVTAARSMNANTRVLVRAHYLREREDLERAGSTGAVFEEAEVAVALARLVLADTGVGRDELKQKVRDLRLQLIMENTTSIRSQRVRNIMVPWTRVRRLSVSATRQDVRRLVAEHRHSRWPVVEPRSGKVVGYLWTRELLADQELDSEWTRLVHPIRTVRSDDDIEFTLLQIQSDNAAMCVVEDSGVPVGLITLDDILEQTVGRIETSFPSEPTQSVMEAIHNGGVLMQLQGTSVEELIAELSAAIPLGHVPDDVNVRQIAVEREQEVPTDLGVGVALPHARCPHLKHPVVMVGKSAEGVLFSPDAAEKVRLVFLLVTPLEQPSMQLYLLAQLARVAGDHATREKLFATQTEEEMLEVLRTGLSHVGGG